MISFTICSCNFLAQAQVLYSSLRIHNQNVEFYVVLCDSPESIDIDSFPFRIIRLVELGIPGLDDMIRRYNITDLNTSIKPFMFSWMFDRYRDCPVVYFDLDVYVVSNMEELAGILDAGADCVLTPHLCEPVEYGDMSERQMLNYGVYNMGFCALRGTAEVRRVVEWWGRRLEADCVIDLAAGLFVDQKWADLFPAFIGRTHILCHPGYNVAYWNLTLRTVRRGVDEWQVNNVPLRFFHFSGSVVDESPVFSRHSAHYRPDSVGDAAMIFHDYVDELGHFGREYYRHIPYAFNWDGESGPNSHTPADTAQDGVEGNPVVAFPCGELKPDSYPPHLPFLRAGSLEEYHFSMGSIAEVIEKRRMMERALVPESGDAFGVEGRCAVCGDYRLFNTRFIHATKSFPDGRRIPNWREHLACETCGLVSRARASLHLFLQQLNPDGDARIYLTEQVTPLYRWLKERFPRLVGSEYLGEDAQPGAMIGEIRHESVQQLSFSDSSFDFILSFDVLGHVPDERRALGELLRCLKPGGTLLFTVPFRDDRQDHEVRAILNHDGTLNHVLPPEHHGNPADRDARLLCYRYFGWDLMGDLLHTGFSDPDAWFYWSRQYGYLGDTNSIFVAKK